MLRKLLNGIFAIVFKPGWPRWALLILVLLVFLVSVLTLSGGTDYRKDPSALVPRSAESYVEARHLDALLKDAGTWRLWKEERRSSEQERHNQLQVDITGLLAERAGGLATRPLSWLSAAERAAYCIVKDDAGSESWALFLQVGDPVAILSEVFVDRELTVDIVDGVREMGVIKVTGKDNGTLYLGVLAPWLIISSADTLPLFALDCVDQPAHSLANAGILPDWRSGSDLRGVYNPAYHADPAGMSAFTIISGWMAPDIRINFLASVRNDIAATLNAAVLTDKVRGGGVWPLVWFLLLLLAVITLVLALLLLLVMIGWGGWLKARAVKAGVYPAAAPAVVDPSPAFTEDTGTAGAASSSEVGVGVADTEVPAGESCDETLTSTEGQVDSGVQSSTGGDEAALSQEKGAKEE